MNADHGAAEPADAGEARERLQAHPRGLAALATLARATSMTPIERAHVLATWKTTTTAAPDPDGLAAAITAAADPAHVDDLKVVWRDWVASTDPVVIEEWDAVASAAYWASCAELTPPDHPDVASEREVALRRFWGPLATPTQTDDARSRATLVWLLQRLDDVNDPSLDGARDDELVPVLTEGHLERVRRWLGALADDLGPIPDDDRL